MKDKSPKQTAAMAGGAIIGGNVARHNIANLLKEKEEKKAPTHTLAKAEKHLQPGDVFFSRAPRKTSPAYGDIKEQFRDTPLSNNKLFKKIQKNLPSFREQDLIRMYGGHPLYHAGIYAGKGNVIHAPDEEAGVVKQRLNDAFEKGTKVHFYRPHKADKQQVQSALRHAHKAVGKPYESRSWINKSMIRELVGPRKKTCGKVQGRYVCTSLVSEAYPKQFKHHLDQPAEMMSKLKPVVHATKGKVAPISIGEHVPPRLIAPVVRSLKLAVPTAGLAYLAKKMKDSADNR